MADQNAYDSRADTLAHIHEVRDDIDTFVAGMDLFDLVEMVCDWMADAERQPDDGVKLAYNVARFRRVRPFLEDDVPLAAVDRRHRAGRGGRAVAPFVREEGRRCPSACFPC